MSDFEGFTGLDAKPYMTPEEINRIEYCQWCGRKLEG